MALKLREWQGESRSGTEKEENSFLGMERES